MIKKAFIILIILSIVVICTGCKSKSNSNSKYDINSSVDDVDISADKNDEVSNSLDTAEILTENQIDKSNSFDKDESNTIDKTDESNVNEVNDEPVNIQVFDDFDAYIAEPVVSFYYFEDLMELGTVQKIDGILPNGVNGTWYIITFRGIEYYYGKYDDIEEPEFWGYSIVSDVYQLKNRISVGMTEEEVLQLYNNMAVIDFEGNFLNKEVIGHKGWNDTSFPRSPKDMDSEWDYNGKDYAWTDQFDYVIIGDIHIEEPDIKPKHIALLIKDKKVAAITYYTPKQVNN